MDAIVESLDNFLEHKEQKVMILKGAWGVGKTHFWKEYISAKRLPNNLKFKIYSSLFGISSIKELESDIFTDAILKDNQDESAIKEFAKSVGSAIKKLKYVKDFSDEMTALKHKLLNNYVVCLDDLERKDPKLTMDSLLGYVSNLAERKKCKVVLIFNDGTLSTNDLKELDKYREKVVDIEVKYSPPQKRNGEIVFSADEFEFICSCFPQYDVNNIRILKKMKWYLNQVDPEISSFSEMTKLSIRTSLIQIAFIHLCPDINITIGELKSIMSFSFASLHDDELEEKKKERDEIRGVLNTVGYTSFDEYHTALIELVENGYLDNKLLHNHIDKLKDDEEEILKQAAHTKMWESYNGNFITPYEDVEEAFYNYLYRFESRIYINEAYEIIKVLTDLNTNHSIKVLVDEYIKARRKVVDDSGMGELSKLAYEYGLDFKLNSELLKNKGDISLKDSLETIVQNKSWSTSDSLYINSFSTGQIYDWLSTDNSTDMIRLILRTQDLFNGYKGKDPTSIVSFQTKLHEAIIKIANESPINKYRATRILKLTDQDLKSMDSEFVD